MFRKMMDNAIGDMEDEVYMFTTRSIWLELEIPQKSLPNKFYEYLGEETYTITNRDDASALLDKIIKRTQEKIYQRIIRADTRYFICDLITLFDKVFEFYFNKKKHVVI